MITEKLKQKINAHSFEWDREERLAKSMEDIFRLFALIFLLTR